MERVSERTHANEAELAAFWAGTLRGEAFERLVAHLDNCQVCTAWLDEVEPALAHLRETLEAVHARVPRSVRPLEGLRKRMDEIDPRPTPRRSRHRAMVWRTAWVSGLAAALALVAFLIRPHGGGSELLAETLLNDAAKSSAKTHLSRRLRIKTSNASFVRAAVLRSDAAEGREEAAMRARFSAAHYDWQDPLSARSYSDWRHTLDRKTSSVTTRFDAARGQEQSIETVTDSGTLRDASLTFDAQLAPVSGWFQFADEERVEIRAEPIPEVVRDSIPDASAERRAQTAAPAASQRETVEPLVKRELRVRLAIDELHAGAGEPIEVSVAADGDIVVTTYHLSPERERQLRAALEGMAGVSLQTGAEGQPPAPEIGEPLDRITRASQDVSFEAHLLAELENRFSSTEGSLSSSEKAKLWGLRLEHALELNRDVVELRRELHEEHRAFRPADSDFSGGAQVRALADSATALDRMVTELYAEQDRDTNPSATWRQLAIEFGRLEKLAAAYSEGVRQHRKKLQ